VRNPGSSATGTGLGLTITRLLTDIMGGDLSVSSSLGDGSIFKASLMLASIDKPFLESLRVPVHNIRGYSGRTRTLMLVDDEQTHRQLMRTLLTPLGFKLIEVDNSLKVLDILAQQTLYNNRPDLIMLDVSMPALNGWELAKKLRSAHFHSPIIMVSADASEGANLNVMHEPLLHDAYITKPVNLNGLLDHIGHLLDLSWHYENSIMQTLGANTAGSSTTISISTSTSIIQAIQLPASEHLDDIAHLAIIGHKKGLQEKINQLEHEKLATPEFIHHLKTLTSHFQFGKIICLVDSEFIEHLE
jgi:CheY-like chemotaxis protein